jgi:hypothetical protein
MMKGAIEKKLSTAGWLIAAGLFVQVSMSFWVSPLAFIAFLGVACPLVIAGMLLFLWALVA